MFSKAQKHIEFAVIQICDEMTSTDLLWAEQKAHCVMFIISMCQIYCDSLFDVIITNRHIKEQESLTKTLHIQLFILCWRRRCIFLYSDLCKQGKTCLWYLMETLQRDFELIGEPKLQQKKQKSIPCRSDFLRIQLKSHLISFLYVFWELLSNETWHVSWSYSIYLKHCDMLKFGGHMVH